MSLKSLVCYFFRYIYLPGFEDHLGMLCYEVVDAYNFSDAELQNLDRCMQSKWIDQ